MPIATEDLKWVAKLTLSKQLSSTPINQIRQDRPWLGLLLRNRQNFLGGKSITQTVTTNNGSNFTNAKGEDPIVFNKRKPTDIAEFDWTRATDAFYIPHDTLKTNGITVKEGKRGQFKMTSDEKVKLSNILRDTTEALRDGFMENLDITLHLNGTQGADCIPALDALIATKPETGTIGGFDRAQAKWWRNHSAIDIDPANLKKTMEQQYRLCIKNGGRPNFIMAGGNFLDAYADCVTLTQNTDSKSPDRIDLGLASSTGTETGLFYKGIPIVYNPTFDTLDELYPSEAVKWANRCYMINDSMISYLDEGFDLTEPTRPYNVLAFYQMMIVRYSMVLKRGNAHSVLSIKAPAAA